MQNFYVGTIKEAVQCIIPYLADQNEPNQVIYFDGWRGLCASAVLMSIAKDPPSSLSNKFDKIIQIDCSRWKSRRALQRTIAQKLSLPQHVMDIFDGQDDEDDFTGIDEASRIEIADAGREIHQALQGQSCLVLFHNGSNRTISLNDFGIPQPEGRWSSFVVKVLWTFRGRLHAMKQTMDQQRVNRNLVERTFSSRKDQRRGKVDNSHIYLYSYLDDNDTESWNELVCVEAIEISNYIRNLVVPSGAATLCCKYMLLLNSRRVDTLEYNWATHASNYWICDGIIQEHQQDNAWDIATALHEEMRLENFSAYRLPYFDDETRWMVATNFTNEQLIKPWTTSFFWTSGTGRIDSLPINIFQTSAELRVLKLCYCTFSFSSPPFLQCRNIRFLGLDNCMDQNILEEDKDDQKAKDTQKLEFFQCLWVLDIYYTDWELNLSQDIIPRWATNIREVNINKGRIWSKTHSWTWKHLLKIHKLRVIKPTYPWETDATDQFTDMVNLDLLDLSGNVTIQILPSLSGALGLSSLVLDGCIDLKYILPGTLPPSLQTFSFDTGAGMSQDKGTKISHISLADCTRLVNFRLRGSLRKLEELDLSNTSIKALDLTYEVVRVPNLLRLILSGCQKLRAVLWPENGLHKIMLLSIDTRGGTQVATSKTAQDSLVGKEQEECCHIRVAVTDMRFLQSLVISGKHFCWEFESFYRLTTRRYKVNLCLSCIGKEDGQNYNKKMVSHTKSLIGKADHQIYNEVNFYEATVGQDASKAWQLQPLDHHVDIGDGIRNTNVVTRPGIGAVIHFMNKVSSLLVHDNSFISTVIPKSMISIEVEEDEYNTRKNIVWSCLKWCRVERCPNLDIVFNTNYDIHCFPELETFWAEDLLVTRCIWTYGMVPDIMDKKSFSNLKALHLQSCPRLELVLPLSWFMLSSLETVHIVYCGNLSMVFPVDAEFLGRLPTENRSGVLEFPKLKHIYLHELPRLQQICDTKIFAPKLETITVRGCWSLKRVPSTTNRRGSRPVVDCEKDWWKKLEWDGEEAGHHPSLFEPRHSMYYKKTMIRGSALR